MPSVDFCGVRWFKLTASSTVNTTKPMEQMFAQVINLKTDEPKQHYDCHREE